MSAELCCGDVIGVQTLIAFENDATGVAEIWTAFTDSSTPWVFGMVSADDGRSSQRPQACSYSLNFTSGMGGTVPRYPVTWTEDGVPGARSHVLGMMAGFGGLPVWVDSLTTSGLGTSGVAVTRGWLMAKVATVWLEEREGQTTLIAKPGEVIACSGIRPVVPSSILLTPGGTFANTFGCS